MIYSLEKIKDKDGNIYKAVVIMGKGAQWFSVFKRTTIKKPNYKAVEEFLEGKIEYTIIEEKES